MTDAGLAAAVRAWIDTVTRRAPLCIVLVLSLAAGCVHLAARHLGFDTDTANLIDSDTPFRQAFMRYTDRFPQYDNTVIAVVEAPAPEFADAAADRLVQALRQRPQRFPRVYRARGNEFLQRNALLFLSPERLQALGDRLAAAQPLLARLAGRPSLAGYFDVLAESAERGRAADMAPVLAATADLIETGDAARVISWQRLMRGEDMVADAGEAPARALVVVAPRLDYERVMAGRAAMQALRAEIGELPLAHPDTRVRLTGKVALQHEELLSALGGAQRAGMAALVLVALVLYVALRSWWLLGVALVTLAAGMCLSAGAATLAVGHLNLISIAFAVLYVGLGINYAVHYLIRYREALAEGHAQRRAVQVAGNRLGGPLTLCTVTTAIGFFAFLPTDFAGVAELGLIAGLSMFITLGVTYTLLPALLVCVPVPAGRGFRAGLPLPGRWIEWPGDHRRGVRWIAGALALAALVPALQVRFDEDPLNLRDPDSESVTAARDLMRDNEGRQNLVVLAEDRQRLARLSRRLEALDTVDTTVDLGDLVPAHQADKLAQIRDLEFILGPTLVERPFVLAADPDPASARRAAARLRDALRGVAEEVPAAGRLAGALDAWIGRLDGAADPSAMVEAFQARALGTLPLAIDRLQTALREAARFDEDDLPRDLRERYRSPDGTYLLQVFPAVDTGNAEARRRFVASVREIAPGATGVPVLQVESGRAVVSAFSTALGSAIAGIALVLLFLLRSLGTTIRVLIPLLLGGLLTVASMVLLGVPFNFANVIALPLLFGVGVDNGIHMATRARELETGRALHTSTARAILFGALTTIVSFGNLALSPHSGTATMGVVLALGMILILATTFIVLPALFRRDNERAPA